MSYIEKQYAVDTGFHMINTSLVNFEDTFFPENTESLVRLSQLVMRHRNMCFH